MNPIHVLLSVIFVVKSVETKCSKGSCEKFACTSSGFVHRPLDSYLKTGSTFNTPCSCSEDWNSVFCNNTLTALTLETEPPPTVCICRKFTDQGAKCKQFITRCFPKKNNQCACCFNQPSKYCNHLKCKNGEPDFSEANTTCVCHHNPADYPFDICKFLYPRDNYNKGLAALDGAKNPPSQSQYIVLFGQKVSTTKITFLIIGLLVTVSIFTLLLLIIGGRRIRNRRIERERQTRVARETLIMQRSDDERYLPSA
ncbi:unnamed protein product [Caenorhabditis bovis]|uniref:EGF-like domain-containing protein n=1 Tax=Caenorhabditis bovis TaxID=2654633 RepID=A0A8S1EKG1_9PELO|nr:unnamed protein product [Caenorhabditis bovis]